MSDHHDDWFKHSPDEVHMEAHGETNSVIILAFLFATIVTVVVTGGLIMQYFKVRVADLKEEVQYSRSDVSPKVQAAREAKENWEKNLTEAHWVDRDKGVVGLPLDVAMQRVIDEYN